MPTPGIGQSTSSARAASFVSTPLACIFRPPTIIHHVYVRPRTGPTNSHLPVHSKGAVAMRAVEFARTVTGHWTVMGSPVLAQQHVFAGPRLPSPPHVSTLAGDNLIRQSTPPWTLFSRISKSDSSMLFVARFSLSLIRPLISLTRFSRSGVGLAASC